MASVSLGGTESFFVPACSDEVNEKIKNKGRSFIKTCGLLEGVNLWTGGLPRIRSQHLPFSAVLRAKNVPW